MSPEQELRDAEFDWVNAYAECSVERTFNELTQRLQSDAESFNELKESNNSNYSRPAPDKVIVSCGHPVRHDRAALFTRNQHYIKVSSLDESGKEKRLHTLQPIVVNKRCLLKDRASKNVYEVWQISDLALGPVFFPDD